MAELKAINSLSLVLIPDESAPGDHISRTIKYQVSSVHKHNGDLYAVIKENSEVQFINMTKDELLVFITSKR